MSSGRGWRWRRRCRPRTSRLKLPSPASPQPEFDTGWRLGLSLALPIFTRHRASVRVEEAALAQLAAERTAAVARITGEVTAATAIADAQRQQYLRYRDVIAPAGQ